MQAESSMQGQRALTPTWGIEERGGADASHVQGFIVCKTSVEGNGIPSANRECRHIGINESHVSAPAGRGARAEGITGEAPEQLEWETGSSSDSNIPVIWARGRFGDDA